MMYHLMKINGYNFSELNSLWTPRSTMVTTHTTRFNIQKLCILPIKCICVSIVIFRTSTLFLNNSLKLLYL
jgi:hypothetical protein